MLHRIYDRYIHKSGAFLFPLLGIRRHQFCRPTQTYIRFKNRFVGEDLRLFCMFQNTPDSRWTLYQRYHLLGHPMLENSTPTADDEEMLYIFNLSEHEADVRHFLKGEYSKFSARAEQLLSDYYGVHTAEWVHMHRFLHPESFYGEYAKILDVEEDVLRAGIELCPIYDEVKETLDVELPANFW